MLLAEHRFPESHRIVAFLAPPWADALSAETGLDLARTKPPVRDIIDDFERVYPNNPILYVIEVHERLVPEPLAELRAGFDWSELSIYDLAGPTGRHGILLGTKRWQGLEPTFVSPGANSNRPAPVAPQLGPRHRKSG